MSTLLLKRLASTVTISSISVALPIKGSSLSLLANSLRLMQCSRSTSSALLFDMLPLSAAV